MKTTVAALMTPTPWLLRDYDILVHVLILLDVHSMVRLSMVWHLYDIVYLPPTSLIVIITSPPLRFASYFIVLSIRIA